MAGAANPNEALPRSYQGKYLIGRVIDNNDPTKCERVRVRVPELHADTIPDDQIPWATPQRHDMIGSTPDAGFFGVPIVGSLVYVELQSGDPHFPVYVGSVRSITNLIPEGDDQGDYPNVYGFVDEVGTKFIVNKVKNTVHVTSTGKVLVTAPEIDVGTDSPQPMVLGDNLAAWITDVLKLWLNNHNHISASPGSPTSPASGGPAGPFVEGDGASGGNVYSTKNRTQ